MDEGVKHPKNIFTLSCGHCILRREKKKQQRMREKMMQRLGVEKVEQGGGAIKKKVRNHS